MSMTDQDRAWNDFLESLPIGYEESMVKAFDYAWAACERSKISKIVALRELLVEWDDDLGEAVKAERARGQSLFEAISTFLDDESYELKDGHVHLGNLRQAMAEYEAGK